MLRRSSVLSASVSVGLAIALLAQPAAAQTAPQVQATPTPTPASSVLVVSPDNAPVISPAPSTAVSVSNDIVTVTNLTLNPTDPAALTSQPASAPPISVTRCGGPTHIFQSCFINVPGGPDNQTVLEQEAVAAVLEQHALPASDATRVMQSARDSIRAALIKKLDAAFRKSKDSRSAAEQAAVDAFTRLARQKHVQAAMIAQNEYTRWASHPCGYTPPAGFSYNVATACAASTSRIFTPPSPGLQAFEAYGVAGAYQTSQIDEGTAHLYGATSSAAILAYAYAGTLGATAVAGGIGTLLPTTAVMYFLPWFAAEAGTAIAMGASAMLVAGPVGIVIAAILTAVVGGIEVFTDANIPGQLQDWLTAAQAYDIGPSLTSTDDSTRAAAVRDLFAVFMQSTLPEFASTDPVPAPPPSDPQFVVQGQKTGTLQYTAWDGSRRMARLSGGGGWLVDAPDSGGPAAWALSLQVLDSDGFAWIASPIGGQFLVVMAGDPANVSSRASTLTTDLPLRGWNGRPITVRLASAPQNESWVINTTPANIGGNGIAHLDPVSGALASVDGGASVVAVGPGGQPWIVNKQGAIFRRSRGKNGYLDGTWETVPGKATELAVGGDGSVWAIGVLEANIGGNMIYHYNPNTPSSWDQVDGGQWLSP